MINIAASRKRLGCAGCLIGILVLAWFLVFTGQEIWTLFAYIGSQINNPFTHQPLMDAPSRAEALNAILILSAYIGGLVCSYLLILMLISQFILPVRTLKERGPALFRFGLFLFGLHGPARRVQEGKLARNVNSSSLREGVVLVDAVSAVAFEKNFRGRGRIEGPGVVFTGRFEKVRTVLSLRKQFRVTSKDSIVKGYTADGIEVKSPVLTVFTLGQLPDVIYTAAVGAEAADVRVIYINPQTSKIREIRDELEPAEKEEIFAFSKGLGFPHARSAPLSPTTISNNHPPFLFDKDRIARAVYRQAEDRDAHTTVDWTHAPLLAATEVFRQVMAHYTYDDLFNPNRPDPGQPALAARQRFARQMRNLGVLSYQWIQRRDGQPPKLDDTATSKDFHFAPVNELHASRVLRDRGIKVIHSGFMELEADEAIQQQRLDAWKAQMQRDIDITLAEFDREVIRIRNQARVEAQREMIFSLSELFQTNPHSEEALAMHLFQALENVASDPSARRLLPAETIQVLRSMRYWLLPGDGGRVMLVDDTSDLNIP